MTDQTKLSDDVEEALSQLTAKQAMFVREYLIDLNATQAAVRAGYSENSAKVIGCENLTKPNVRTAIDLAMGRRAERIETSADWVVQELAKNHAVATDRGEIAQSNRALELIGKHHKTFTDKVEIYDAERLSDEELERRIAELENPTPEGLGEAAAAEGGESTASDD